MQHSFEICNTLICPAVFFHEKWDRDTKLNERHK